MNTAPSTTATTVSISKLLAQCGLESASSPLSDHIILMESIGRAAGLADGIAAVGKLLRHAPEVDQQTAAGIGCLLDETGGLLFELLAVAEETRAVLVEKPAAHTERSFC